MCVSALVSDKKSVVSCADSRQLHEVYFALYDETMLAMRLPLQPENTGLGFVMQTMTDYKPHQRDIDIEGLMDEVRLLKDGCVQHKFVKGDKLPTITNVRERLVRGVLKLELHGEALGKWHFPLDIPLAKPFKRGKKVETLHDALMLFCATAPGGNAPNELRDIAHCMEAGIGPSHVEVFTSTDPLFQSWYAGLSEPVRERIRITVLGENGQKKGSLGSFPPRQGLHLPYRLRESHGTGTLAISNPASSTVPYIRGHLETLLKLDHTIVSEGLSVAMLETTLPGRQNFLQKLNPSSAFRSQCAIDSWEGAKAGGRPPILTMNNDEFDYYIRCIKARVEDDVDPDKLDPIPLPSPFGSGEEVNVTTVAIANDGFREYLRHVPARQDERLHILLNVSAGAQGGYHLATKGSRRYVVYSTIPDKHGTHQLIRLVGRPAGLHAKTERSMGAGDSVGAILSLANIWDLEELLAQYASSNRRGSPSKEYVRAAAVIFVSLLSRYIGECLYRTERCDMTDIPPENIRLLIDHAAKQALIAADDVWNVAPRPKGTVVANGIRLALWELVD